MVLVATPLTLASKDSNNMIAKGPQAEDDDHNETASHNVTISGNVTALLYDDDWQNETDDDDNASAKNKTHEPRLCAFVIDNETVVTFGPWWYWTVQNVTVADVVHLNDTVNVTGVLEEEDGMTVLCAWCIENETTGDELTITGEGRPPWAGGPKALGIDPWPPSDEDN